MMIPFNFHALLCAALKGELNFNTFLLTEFFTYLSEGIRTELSKECSDSLHDLPT